MKQHCIVMLIGRGALGKVDAFSVFFVSSFYCFPSSIFLVPHAHHSFMLNITVVLFPLSVLVFVCDCLVSKYDCFTVSICHV